MTHSATCVRSGSQQIGLDVESLYESCCRVLGDWWTLSWRSVGWEADTGPIRVSPSQCVYVSVVCSSVRFLFLIMNLS